MALEASLLPVPDESVALEPCAARLDAALIAAARRLRVIVRGGVGTDNIDLAAAAARGVAVLNTPAASTASVAELALGMLLALARRIPQADAAIKAGGWPKREFADGIQLAGKTLGMVVVGTDPAPAPAGRFAVFATEPPVDRRLAGHPRVVCTPHLGAATGDAQARVGSEVAELLLARL